MTLYGIWSSTAADRHGFEVWATPTSIVFCTSVHDSPNERGEWPDAESVGEVTEQIPIVPIDFPKW